MKIKKLVKYLQTLPKNTKVFTLKEVESDLHRVLQFKELEEKDLYYDENSEQLIISED